MTYEVVTYPALSPGIATQHLAAMVNNTKGFTGRVVTIQHDELTMVVTGCGPLGTYNAERICKALTLLDKADAWLQANYNAFEPDNQSERYLQFKAFYEQAVK